MTEPRRQHWDGVYRNKSFTDVSWYQSVPERSLQCIDAAGIALEDAIIDVGGGASTLVDHLLRLGYGDVTVLDIAGEAFAQSRDRLGAAADGVDWIVTDVTAFEPARRYALWHDRAVLHFLTEDADRKRYVSVLRQSLAAGGQVILATFGPDGPLRCSGLEIRRYSAGMMQELLGEDFVLLDRALEEHRTPNGANQQFLFTRWRRRE
jgi:SAM-dependent methyltransferase